MAGLHFAFTADNRNFMNALNQITSGMRDATRQIEANGGSIDKVIGNIKAGLVTLGIGATFKEIAGQVSSVRGEFQQLEVAFETLLGNKEKSDALMAQMIHTAAITPFGMTDVANGAKQLLAYGTAAEDVNDTLIRLGDIAAGLSLPLGDLVMLYGTTMTQGQVFTQDLRQFMGRGIPLADELAKQFGVTKDKVGELVTAGKVGAKEFNAAIISMTNEGSKFGGLMEKQSKTISGQISNIEDAIEQMFNEIGKENEGIISGTLSATSTIVENWQTVIGVLGAVAAAYGTQKAVLALESGFTTAAINYGYDAEIAQLSALIPQKEQVVQTELQQAVASGKLTQAKAEQILALRAEAEAYIESLALKEAEARQNEINAQSNLTTALQEQDIAKEMVASAEEKWKAAYDSADAIAEEAAMQELETARAIEAEAADSVAAATKEAKAASSAHVAAQQATENASTAANTAQTTGNTAATGILTIAKEKLAAAILKVNAALKANQFAIATGAIIAMGYAVYKLATYQNDYQKSLNRLNDSEKEYNKSVMQEQRQIDILFGKLKNAKKGTQEYSDAKDAIMKNYGSYLTKLGDESTALNDVAKAYDLVRDSATQAAKARALDSYLKKEDDQYVDDLANEYEKIKKIIAKKKGDEFAEIHSQDIRDIVEGRTKVNPEFLKQFDNYVYANGITYNANSLAAAIGRSNQRRENYNKAVAAGEDRYGIKRTGANQSSGNTTQESTNLKEAYDKAKKDYEDAKSLVAKMNADRASYTEAAYEKATANLKEYKEAYEKLGGVTKESKGATAEQSEAKTASENQQLLDLMKKQAEERLKQQQEYEYELWQNRIDLMEEGEAKVLEQMRLDNSKEQTALKERQQQEIQAEIARQKAVFDAQEDINASKDKKYAEKTFNPDVDVDRTQITAINERYDKLYADLKSKQEKAYQDRLDAARQSMNAYLAEFGSYQQKRLAIQEEYDTKIAEAQNAGERMTLMAQRNQKLSDLDFEEWQNKGGMALAFGDVSKLSGDTIKDLIAKMEEYRTKVIATFDPDKIKKYEDALNNLRMADIDMQFDFGGDVEGLKERLALVKQINDAEANNAALQAQKEDLEAQLNDLDAKFLATSGINTAAAIPDANGDPMAQTNVMGMSAEDVQLAEELRVRIAQIANALLASTENSKQLQSRLKEASKIKFADVQKLSQNMLGAGRNAATLAGIFDDDLGDAISDAVDKVETLMGAFEDVSASIDTLAKAGKDVVEKTVDASTELVDGASTAMQTSASMTATSLNTMKKASAILAIIGAAIQVATVVASLFDSDKKHERNIERLQDQIDALQKSYDNLDRKIQKTYSYDASNLIKSQEALIQQQMFLVQQQMAEEEAKKKTDDDKMKDYRDTLDDLRNQLADLKESAKDAIFGDDINSAIENFESAYASAWENGESRVMSARDTVKQMMRQMVEESIKAAIQSSGQMEKIRNSLVEFYSDGFLSAEEQNYVYAIAEELQRSLDEKYAQQGDLLSGSYSQFPSSGGWDTMSQDSADALNGRFTALAETGENIRVINAGIAENVMANLMVANSQRELMQEALNIHIINMGHLETISRHTRQLAAMSENLEKIERYVRNI